MEAHVAPTTSLQAQAAVSGGPQSDRVGTLWVGDLPYFADENYLHRFFVNTGSLVSVKVMRNKNTQISLGYGFLEFSSHEAASEVLEQFNNTPMPGTHSNFRLNWAAFGVGKPVAGIDFSCFVGDLAPDVTDFVLQEVFHSRYPSVRSAKVITDPLTGRTKGFGFVRFGDENEKDQAIQEMVGTVINDRPIRVSTATAKKAPSPQLTVTHPDKIPHPSDFDPTNTTIFIGGLSGGVNEHTLREVFGPFGDIIYTKVPANKGCGFCQFVERSSAEAAMLALQDKRIGDNNVRLSWGRSAVASRPAQLRGHFNLAQFPSPYTAVPTNVTGFPMYSLGQGNTVPSSQLYSGLPQGYQQAIGAESFAYGNPNLVHQGNVMESLSAQFAQLSAQGRGGSRGNQ